VEHFELKNTVSKNKNKITAIDHTKCQSSSKIDKSFLLIFLTFSLGTVTYRTLLKAIFGMILNQFLSWLTLVGKSPVLPTFHDFIYIYFSQVYEESSLKISSLAQKDETVKIRIILLPYKKIVKKGIKIKTKNSFTITILLKSKWQKKFLHFNTVFGKVGNTDVKKRKIKTFFRENK